MPLYQQGEGKTIPIRDFAPDLAPTEYGGWGQLLDMTNAVPTTVGYRARRSPQPFAPALPELPIGAYVAMYGDGSLSIIAGGPKHLYRLVNNAWSVIDTTGPFNILADGNGSYPRWRFFQFNDDVIAVNSFVSTPLVASGPVDTFHALAGGPPTNPITGISVGGITVLYKGFNWFASAAGTDNNFTPNVQTQAANGTITDYPGPILAAQPFFRTQVIFKGASFNILSFVGGDTIWNNQLASNATGTWGQECTVATPEAIFFIGNDDFWQMQGYAPTRLPNNVRDWFFRNVYRGANNNPIFLQNSWTWYDPERAVIYWHWVSNAANFQGVCDRYLSYNVRVNRWGTGYLNTPCVVGNTQPGQTSGLFFDTNNVLQTWTGTPGSMGLLTGYLGEESRLTQLMKARATYNDGQAPVSDTISVLSTYVLGKGPIVGPPAAKGVDDWFNMRAYSRFHQLHLITTGATEVTGFAGEARAGGNR